MADKTVVHTLFGKHSKYEIVKVSGFWTTKFYIRKAGKPHRGSFPSLKSAVEAAEKEG